MGALTALAVIKNLRKKAMPVIKAYACKQCYTLASVTLHNGNIRVTKCNCYR